MARIPRYPSTIISTLKTRRSGLSSSGTGATFLPGGRRLRQDSYCPASFCLAGLSGSNIQCSNMKFTLQQEPFEYQYICVVITLWYEYIFSNNVWTIQTDIKESHWIYFLFFCGFNIVVGVGNRGYRCNHFYHFRFSYKGKVAKHRIEVKKAVFVESNCQVKEGDYWDKQLFNNISWLDRFLQK